MQMIEVMHMVRENTEKPALVSVQNVVAVVEGERGYYTPLPKHRIIMLVGGSFIRTLETMDSLHKKLDNTYHGTLTDSGDGVLR